MFPEPVLTLQIGGNIIGRMTKSRKTYPKRPDSATLGVAEGATAASHVADALMDQRLFVLHPDDYDAFLLVLDNPPAPGTKLRSLLRRIPAWKG